MSDTTIQPALTPDEWAERIADRPVEVANEWSRVGLSSFEPDGLYVEELGDDGCQSVHVHPRARHALAAFALYGQPFGFTHADSDLLSDAAGRIVGEDHAQRSLADALMALADRIGALLPARA